MELRLDDLVGGPLLQISVLVDARFVGEGVLADNRLVPLNRYPRHMAHQAAGGVPEHHHNREDRERDQQLDRIGKQPTHQVHQSAPGYRVA